jgi:putative PIN family toxin of toxin-antitoxin system
MDELADVLSRPRIRKRYVLADEDVATFIGLLVEGAEIVETVGESYGCRDADDDAVIETAVRSGAQHVVSRDDDLKDDAELAASLAGLGIQVISVRRFLATLEGAAR